jgi:hypothetical protein
MRQSHGSINASTGSFDPDTLTMLYQAFDETWRQIGGNYPDEPKQLNGNQADPQEAVERSNDRSTAHRSRTVCTEACRAILEEAAQSALQRRCQLRRPALRQRLTSHKRLGRHLEVSNCLAT